MFSLYRIEKFEIIMPKKLLHKQYFLDHTVWHLPSELLYLIGELMYFYQPALGEEKKGE
jgi:hypothetical protein